MQGGLTEGRPAVLLRFLLKKRQLVPDVTQPLGNGLSSVSWIKTC